MFQSIPNDTFTFYLALPILSHRWVAPAAVVEKSPEAGGESNHTHGPAKLATAKIPYEVKGISPMACLSADPISREGECRLGCKRDAERWIGKSPCLLPKEASRLYCALRCQIGHQDDSSHLITTNTEIPLRHYVHERVRGVG
jgi:hypothetical protein